MEKETIEQIIVNDEIENKINVKLRIEREIKIQLNK